MYYYILEGAQISQRKEKQEKEKKPFYKENPGYPFSEKLPNISLSLFITIQSKSILKQIASTLRPFN
jgi:hypothetical protein